MRKHEKNTRVLRPWDWTSIAPKEREYWLIPKDVFEFIFHLNRRGQRKVYDLGCGIGRNLFFLIDMGFDVRGSEYSHDAVNEVNRHLEEIKYPHMVKQESMTEISEPDISFDAIIAYHVVYHSYVADMRRALRHIHQILKPGEVFS